MMTDLVAGALISGGAALLIRAIVMLIRWHHELSQFVEELADLDRSRPEDIAVWALAPPELARPPVRRAEICQGRVSALHEDMERRRGPEDTQTWRFDTMTGWLIPPRHTRHIDWPEAGDWFRPVPPPGYKP